MKLNINQILQKGIAAHNEGKLQEAEKFYISVLKAQPAHPDANHNLGVIAVAMNNTKAALPLFQNAIKAKPLFVEAHYNLANLLKDLGRPEEAEVSYKKAIEFKPNFTEAYSNRGNLLKDLGRLEEAEASYKKAIEFKPNFTEAYSNRGNLLKDLGRYDEAILCYKKAISLNPDIAEPHFNLGIILYNRKKYKEAMEQFKLIDFQESKNYILKCLYSTNQKSDFYKQLDNMINQGELNAVIGSLVSRSKIKYKINKSNPFCNDPLKYVLKTNLYETCDFKNIFIKTARDILKEDKILSKTQGYLTNGRQTAGNIFALEGDHIDQIKNIIHSEIEKYYIHFKNNKEGFLMKWPTSYTINGWLINMKSGGNLNAHMHDTGWITGSIYINVPLKSKVNSGNLVVCLDDEENDVEEKNKEKSIINVVTGSLCLFPASLLHYTIPFEAEEDRIVLAFDVVPK